MIESLSLADAKYMLEAAERKAYEIRTAYSAAVVDASGYLVAFFRQDDALIGSIEIAANKARTARMFDATTEPLAELTLPTGPLFGLQDSSLENIVVFGGGVPVIRNGVVVGAVGASAGTVQQDIAVAEASVATMP